MTLFEFEMQTFASMPLSIERTSGCIPCLRIQAYKQLCDRNIGYKEL